MTRQMHIDHYVAIVDALISSGNKLPDALERAERIHEVFYGRRRYVDLTTAEQAHQQYQHQHAPRR